jgi:RecA-family ATPase
MSKDALLPAEDTAEVFERQSQAVQQFAEWDEYHYNTPDPIRYMGEWLVQGCVSTLFAPSGVGKSFAVMDAARAIALGEDPFGGAPLLQNECKGRNIRGLLITTEMSIQEVVTRHGREFMESLRATDKDGNRLGYNHLELITKYKLKTLDEPLPDLLNDIEDHLIQEGHKDRPFRFLCIDNLTTAYPALLSGNEEAAKLMRRIMMLAETYQLAVLQVMHMNKKGQGLAEYSQIDEDAIKGNKMINIYSQIFIGFNESRGSDGRFYAIQTKTRSAKKTKIYRRDNCAVFEFVDYIVDGSEHARVEFVCTSTEEAERHQSKKEMMSDAQMRCFQIWDEDTARTGEPSKIGFSKVAERLDSKYRNAAGELSMSERTVKNWKSKWKAEFDAGERPNAHAF